MFDPTSAPRVFGVPPGPDFPQVLANGLRARMAGRPAEAMARVEVIVNTARMQARLREALIRQGQGFLPRLRLIGDLAGAEAADTGLRTRLALAQTIRALLAREPDLAPGNAAHALADGLFRLLDEMQGEAVPLSVLERLDVSNHSEHWTRSLRFIRLIGQHFGPVSGGQGRLRRSIALLADHWANTPPDHPVILAGSSGSRGPSALLMQAIAGLPQGAVVLPGLDTAMPQDLWDGLRDPMIGEDHPQFRYARLLRGLGLKAGNVRPWHDDPGPQQRNALVSLALRPAPVTDQWLRDGPALGDLLAPTRGITLVEAGSPRQEALSIALALRQAAVDGRKAALITPDRTLARRVTAVLDRWHIRPDDSAGRPLSLSAPGRYLRQIAELMRGGVTAQALVSLLKHPITHSASGRGAHLLHLRDLELYLRRKGLPYPDAAALRHWADGKPPRQGWAAWLIRAMSLPDGLAIRSLSAWLETHLAFAEHLARGPEGGEPGELWKTEAGGQARAMFDALLEVSDSGGEMPIGDYSALLETVFAGREVREGLEAHPHVMIWGTLEARAQGADLIVLGGLNDGVWPSAPQPDPWFNRQMRLDAGLLLPERQVGLSAHDFQIAVAGAEVMLVRATRDADAETVPSRWLNRLTNLIAGLPAQSGPEALAQMRARGAQWLALADAHENHQADLPARMTARNPRPAPAPPPSARPRELAVTQIETLIRDPYQIYAQSVLRLRSLDPLSPEADARLRGTVLHQVLDDYVQRHPPGTPGDVDSFMQVAEAVLTRECPWHSVRLHWLARLQPSAAAFMAWNAGLAGTPSVTESKAALSLRDPAFTLIGKPDRIDVTSDNQAVIYDYKTGALPSKSQQTTFSKQLVLLALMVEDGAFAALGAMPVAAAAYVGLGSKFGTMDADVSPESLARHRAELAALLSAYLSPEQGFTAMRAVEKERWRSDYHPLARRGEWQPTDDAVTIKVGDDDA